MDYGLVLFTSDRGIAPAAAAKLADDHGFTTFYVPEHTHIPVKRQAAHPTTGDESLPDDRYMRTLDPWVSAWAPRRGHLAGAAVDGGGAARRTRPDHPGQIDRHARPPLRRAGSASASDSVGTQTNSPTTTCRPAGGAPCCASTSKPCARCGPRKKPSYDGEFVNFGPSWAWPKPVQSHIPVLVGAAGTEKNFKWIARTADGWITTPRDFDIDEPVKLLQDTWAAAGRDGAPQIVALDFKPDPDKLARWADLGVTEVLFGLPDKSDAEVAGYVERLAGKLAALV